MDHGKLKGRRVLVPNMAQTATKSVCGRGKLRTYLLAAVRVHVWKSESSELMCARLRLLQVVDYNVARGRDSCNSEGRNDRGAVLSVLYSLGAVGARVIGHPTPNGIAASFRQWRRIFDSIDTRIHNLL